VADADAPLDAERILRVLFEHKVEYVLIGGLAVQTHGHVRTTNDADLFPAPDPANLERLAAALRELDARVLNPGREDTEVDAGMLSRATIWQFATREGGIDVMHEVPGGDPYIDLSERALHVELGEVDVPVVDLDDLIRMKLARGRPLDLADVAALTDPGAAETGIPDAS
jgi:predicted nucleotidyltransferase